MSNELHKLKNYRHTKNKVSNDILNRSEMHTTSSSLDWLDLEVESNERKDKALEVLD